MNNNSSIINSTSNLLKLIPLKRKIHLLFLFLLMVLASISEVLSIGSIVPFLAVLINPENVFNHKYSQIFIHLFHIKNAKELIFPVTLGFSLLVLFSAAIRLFVNWVQLLLSAKMAIDFMIKTYEHTLYQPYVYHSSNNSSEVQSVLVKAGELSNCLVSPLLNIFSSLLLLFFVSFALISINPLIVLASVSGFLFIYLIISVFTRNMLKRYSYKMSYQQGKIIKSVQEGIGGIRDVLLNGVQATYVKIYEKAVVSYRNSLVSLNILSMSPRFLVEAIGLIFIAFISYFTISNRLGGNLSNAIPLLGVMAMAAQRMLPILQTLYLSYTTIKGNQKSIDDAINVLSKTKTIKSTVHNFSNRLLFKNKIILSDIGFKYSEISNWVFQNINMTIIKGERVGIIGGTASGKSTLLDLIMKLLEPTTGSITIDDVLITKNNAHEWQKNISHVPQTIFLSDSTIAENIAFGIEPHLIDYNKVQLVAENAHLLKDIKLMEKQFDTLVGERGARLSGGQRQRIGIARALYKDADVIIFDEATSALDNYTESEVMNSIENLNRDLTVIIVAHRLTTLKFCDRIFELINNELKIHNSYEELIRSKK